MLVADTEDPVTSLAALLLLPLVEEERDGALGILHSDMHPQRGSQHMTDAKGRVGIIDHEWRALELLHALIG